METEIFAIYSQDGVSGTRQGIIRDLSAGGMMVHSGFSADVGNIVQLNFSLPSGEQVKDLTASVVRTAGLEDSEGSQINLKFEDVNEKTKGILATYIESLLRQTGEPGD